MGDDRASAQGDSRFWGNGMTFRPTLAVAADFSKIRYPVYASPKLDGIRCSIDRKSVV